MKNPALLILGLGLVTLTVALSANEPIYKVSLNSAYNFTLVRETSQLTFHPSSPSAKSVYGKRKVVAADTQTGIILKTTKPGSALQTILNQISLQTGLQLAKYVKSPLVEIAPVTLFQGFSETAVITLLLTPTDKGEWILTCSYVIYERPEGSIDGTPESIRQMQAMFQQMNADSIAVELPQSFTKEGINYSDYYRGGLGGPISDTEGKNLIQVLTLHLKSGDTYTLGIYREHNGTWQLIDQPIDLTGFGPAGLKGTNGISSLRARKVGASAGIDFFIEHGLIIRKDYKE